MALFDKGLSANINLPAGNKSGGADMISQLISKVKGGVQVGRVTDIILNKNYPGIDDYGGDSAIGTIFFELNDFIGDDYAIAKPFSPQTSAYPLIDEMVLIFNLPSKNIGVNTKEKEYYYLSIINLWGSPHHNAYPNPLKSKDVPLSQQKTYQQSEGGSPNKITSQNLKLDFNSPFNPSQATFFERSNIKPLLPFAGDIIHQGRWGNSIRFGSTAKPFDLTQRVNQMSYLNDWSSTGQNGDPITIFINGQNPNNPNPGYVHITENINEDLSSIYMTSKQLIPIKVKNKNYHSYTNGPNFPSSPSSYINPQILLNSDRLVLNAKKDHILLSSAKSIFLGSNSSLNVSTKEVVIDSRSIKIGSKNATEPIILGNKFLSNLEVIMKEISALCGAISSIQEVTWVNPETGKPNKINAVNGKLKIIADNLSNMIEGGGVGFIDQIESYKSKVNKII